MKSKSYIKTPYKFALIGGIFWGATLFLATLISTATGFAASFLLVIGGMYPGYEISFSGSFIGLFFGFMDGFVICYLIAYLFGGKKVKSKI